MRQLRGGAGAVALASILVAACSSGSGGAGSAGTGAAGTGGGTGGAALDCGDAGTAAKGIAHVIIVVQENHTFDTYFGAYCTAAPGSSPTCTSGPACCEAAPAKDPTGASPTPLSDAENGAYDPDHTQACEVSEIDGGKMDAFATGADCSDPRNFAIAAADVAQPYWDLAAKGAIADRYFQPIAGQSSSNDMYLAVAKEVFIDNAYEPRAPGAQCEITPPELPTSYTGQTIADVLQAGGKQVAWYSEGWALMAAQSATSCPPAPKDCPSGSGTYPCVFDPGDVPFLYYAQFASSTTFMRDYGSFATDIAGGTLPDVSYVKALGYHSEHPGAGDTISAGTTFVDTLVQTVEGSCYRDNTLILITWDEGGGFFDHVAPPPTSTVDNQPYGMRIPLIAVGPFAKKGTVSHVTMEHSSIVKFLEWNYLDGKTGQLGARDAVVNNIGSLLDPTTVGETVPDQ